jgi:hypothetical protein
MSLQFKSILLLCCILLLGSSAVADKIHSRPTSNYGFPSNITVAGPNTISGSFTETIVCGLNTTPVDLTTCDATLPFAPGVFDLLVDTPVLTPGTIVTLTLDSSAFNVSNTFGLLTGCDQEFTSFASCINKIGENSACVDSIFGGLSGTNSKATFTVPSCASKGVTLFFDETGPIFASVSTTAPVATPEPNSALLLLLGMILASILARRLVHQ